MTGSLDTPRLFLERFDAETVASILSDVARSDWAEGFPTGGERRVAEWLERRGGDELAPWPFVPFVVRERESGQLIGSAGFHGAPRGRVVEIGYGLVESKRHLGLATEACATLVKVAFDSGQVDRVLATIDERNAPSRSVLERTGFRELGERPLVYAIDRV